MESRRLLAADPPFGATPVDTGEFLLGTVTVTPVFFESDGSIDPNTEDWSPGEIDATLAKIRDSVDWWSDLLATQQSVHTLDFVIDDTYAQSPVSTGYEPIARSSDVFQRYVGDWLTDLGYGDAPSIERAVHLFNDNQRQTFETDWAFTIFVVDSSNDQANGDGFFASGAFVGAFAYPGGLFMVVPSGRPVSTFSHEMGHIFWARDEYPGAGSWTDQRGYYNAQNFNASDNPTNGFVQQISIMRGGSVAKNAFDQVVSPASTLALLGWKDSDGDGVFDVLDVPLEFEATGFFDAVSSTYNLTGTAAVDTLANQNSSGPQSDITLARVSELQYRLDGGDWITALSPDDSRVDIDLKLEILAAFNEIDWRVIDTNTGITSDTLSGTTSTHLFSGNGGGFLFLDPNADQTLGADEILIAGASVKIRHQDGRALFQSSVTATSLPEGEFTSIGGLDFAATGTNLSGRVGAFDSATLPGRNVLKAHATSNSSYRETWNSDQKLVVASQEHVGRVQVDFIAMDTGTFGFESGSYARIEAFDQTGTRLDRVTSDLVLASESGQLVVEDPLGRIASISVYGHAETEILIDAVHFGQSDTTITDESGSFQITGLPDGGYTLEFVSPNLTYDLPTTGLDFTIDDGNVAPIAVATGRIDSPRFNSGLLGDVNGDEIVSARDALVIINDLSLRGNRTLGSDETLGFFVDANNDGQVSAIDALTVINLLSQNPPGEGEQVESSSNGNFLNSRVNTPPLQANPLSPSAIDSILGSEKTQFGLHEMPSSPADSDQNGPLEDKMLNYAGQPTSDQSLRENHSDSSTEANPALNFTHPFDTLENEFNR